MARPDIVIVDYGMANLRSVQKAFEAVGHAAVVSADPDVVGGAAKLVLPGVGAFEDAIAKLRQSGLAESITSHVTGGRPFLGICLGLQMLFTRSHEGGLHPGTGPVPRRGRPLPGSTRLESPAHGLEHAELPAARLPDLRRPAARPGGSTSSTATTPRRSTGR